MPTLSNFLSLFERKKKILPSIDRSISITDKLSGLIKFPYFFSSSGFQKIISDETNGIAVKKNENNQYLLGPCPNRDYFFQNSKKITNLNGEKIYETLSLCNGNINEAVKKFKAFLDKDQIRESDKSLSTISKLNKVLINCPDILKYFPNSLNLAQHATTKFANSQLKPDISDNSPMITSQCLAYVTMLFKLMHHQGDMKDESYKTYLEESYNAGFEFLIKSDLDAESKRTSSDKLKNAIYGNELPETNNKSLSNQSNGSITNEYKALSDGFQFLRELKETVKTGKIEELKIEEFIKKEMLLNFENLKSVNNKDTSEAFFFSAWVKGSLCGAYLGYEKIPEFFKTKEKNNYLFQETNLTEKYQLGELKLLQQNHEKKLADTIFKIKSSHGKLESTDNDLTLVKPFYNYKEEKQDFVLHSKIKNKDQNGYTRGLDFRYNSLNKNSPEEAYNQINNNLKHAMHMAKIDDKQTVLMAIKIAKKYGGLSNFFNDKGERVTDDAQILSIINEQYKTQLTQPELKKMMILSFHFQDINKKNQILTGRQNGSQVGLRLTYVSDEVIARFSLDEDEKRSEVTRTI